MGSDVQILVGGDEFERRVRVHGVDFDESFLAHLISDYFGRGFGHREYRLSDAVDIYIRERAAGRKAKFRRDAYAALANFIAVVGDLPIHALSHQHICSMRDDLLRRGLSPTTVRKQTSFLNAALNKCFQVLDINRLSPFRSLYIEGEGARKRDLPSVSLAQLVTVKQYLLLPPICTFKLVGLLQLNTGLRISEPVFARVEDCVVDAEIPHIWIRPNALTECKTKSSIRQIPLVGISLWAAQRLRLMALSEESDWLVPRYARLNGNVSCSGALNKYLKPYNFRSHLFRHSLIDRMKACNDIPFRVAESITGHATKWTEYDNYGTVGYTLAQKLDVLTRVVV